MRLRVLVLSSVLAILVAAGSVSLVHGQEHPPPSVKIVSLNYPRHIIPGERFHVNVTVDYSDSFLSDIGIWNGSNGTLLEGLTLISSFQGPGKRLFEFNLTAPEAEVAWHLLAIVRVWWQDAWYEDPHGGSAPFLLEVSRTVTLHLTVKGTDTTIAVDGKAFPVSAGSASNIPLKPGIHILQAPFLVKQRNDQRFLFDGWSTGDNSNPLYTRINADMSITANYDREYYLNVKSQQGHVSGSGWYRAGDPAGFALGGSGTETTLSYGLFNTVYNFAGWSGDSSSAAYSASVIMDRPKTVEAAWTRVGVGLNPVSLSVIFFLGGVLMVGRAFYFYIGRERRGYRNARVYRGYLRALLVLSIVVVGGVLGAGSVSAQPPQPQDASTVKIGDASWYYWYRAGSDTCILWLGGGISQETLSGYNYYWINPFSYESFNTMRFVQDLAKYYSVIALEAGSYLVTSGANRTIHLEMYDIQSNILSQVHDWVKAHGYLHTYLVGYSVGGQAAATELTVRDPEAWSSQDGLVSITVPFRDEVVQDANHLRANLLLLYGGNLPEYEATGRAFYQNAPKDGWYGDRFYSKGFHIMPEAGHEIWTVRATGSYNETALSTIISFIEESKALQLGANLNSWSTTASHSHKEAFPGIIRKQIVAPEKVHPGQVFKVNTDISYDLGSGNKTVGLAVYNTGENRLVSFSSRTLTGHGDDIIESIVNTSPRLETLHLAAIPLVKAGEEWLPIDDARFLNTSLMDHARLTIRAPTPSLPVYIDGNRYATQNDGTVTLTLKIGEHSLQVLLVFNINNETRLVFSGWSDSATKATRNFTVTDDVSLDALYDRQYLVIVESAYGKVMGSGWYDANSTASLTVQPVRVENPKAIFIGWTGDVSAGDAAVNFQVHSPKKVNAVWLPDTNSAEGSSPGGALLLLFSLIFFGATLIWNVTLQQGEKDDAVEYGSGV